MKFMVLTLLLPLALLTNSSCFDAYNKIRDMYPAACKKEVDASTFYAAMKGGYLACLGELYDLNTSQIKYSSLKQVSIEFMSSLGIDSDIMELMVIKVIGRYADRLKQFLSFIVGFLVAESTKETTHISLDVPASARLFTDNFLRYSGLIENASKACQSQIDILIQQIFESICAVWISSDPLSGVQTFLDLNTHFETLVNVCPPSLQSSWNNFWAGSWTLSYNVFQNVIRRSGVIVSSGLNGIMAATKMNLAKAGAWLGIAVYNTCLLYTSPSPRD
eukprot:TRINITY_DN6091_c0_g3_i7.p1 TRINITY_DN6091_c0_g3~~TRINITY_DN6091_c0_g3_i7.p1  ORF type:complete len:304 (+),score=46.75 TRINITY_DN6091_c0_g3_i7:85-912(+)